MTYSLSPHPVSAHSILKKSPPRKNKYGKAERGEGGAPSPRGAGRIVRVTTQSERTHWSKATTQSERTISQSFVGKKFAQRILLDHKTLKPDTCVGFLGVAGPQPGIESSQRGTRSTERVARSGPRVLYCDGGAKACGRYPGSRKEIFVTMRCRAVKIVPAILKRLTDARLS